MPRIRTLTAVGVLAGATVLGGAGLAGATDDTSEAKEQELVEDSQTQQLTTFEGDELIEDEETETEEAPTAPTLPDTAAERATTALAEAPAFAGGEIEPTEPETEGEQSLESDEGTTDGTGTKPDNHGQRVSEVARSDDPGPGPEHGPAVSEEAKENGQGGERTGDTED